MDDERLALAEAFLCEAVFRSRARQAASASVLGVDLNAAAGPGTCGLGEKAAVELDLSERGVELYSELWPGSRDDAVARAIESTMAGWVRRNDALDRKRNHFLKDFRREQGFDRSTWSAEVLERYERGLADVNAEVADGLRESARSLLN